jgi:BirA family biotin operon repressor/biotin-[acetyl-CoA-carboxylase] ligase
MEITQLQDVLKNQGRELRYLATTGSTNADAMEWLANGATDGCVVAADEQTAGRGRFDRKWVTLPGSALAFSMIIRPTKAEYPYLPLFTPLAGIAVSAAVESLCALNPHIKWPNDVLLDGKKVCGILGEAVWNENRLEGLVLGIGVNVKSGSIPPPGDVSFNAGCLEDAAGTEIDRVQLLAEILVQFDRWRPNLGSSEFIAYWQERLAFIGQEVKLVATAGAEVTGRLVGVDQTGELILDTGEGEITVQVGDVHLRLRED